MPTSLNSSYFFNRFIFSAQFCGSPNTSKYSNPRNFLHNHCFLPLSTLSNIPHTNICQPSALKACITISYNSWLVLSAVHATDGTWFPDLNERLPIGFGQLPKKGKNAAEFQLATQGFIEKFYVIYSIYSIRIYSFYGKISIVTIVTARRCYRI